MGGLGSGQWYRWGTKNTVEGHRAIDIRTLHREGRLQPDYVGISTWTRNGEVTSSVGWIVHASRGTITSLELWYTLTPRDGEPQDYCYHVPIVYTRCTLGGQRPWFQCPGCARRVVRLYFRRVFRCRHCHDLVYQSQRDSAADRALHKIQDIRERLGGSANMQTPFPWKPKRMHWKTYWRIREQAEEAEAVYYDNLAALLGRLTGRAPWPHTRA